MVNTPLSMENNPIMEKSIIKNKKNLIYFSCGVPQAFLAELATIENFDLGSVKKQPLKIRSEFTGPSIHLKTVPKFTHEHCDKSWCGDCCAMTVVGICFF